MSPLNVEERTGMICRVCENRFRTDIPVMVLQIKDAASEDLRVPFYLCPICENLSASDAIDESFHIERYKREKQVKHSKGEMDLFFRTRDKKQNKLNKLIARHILDAAPKMRHRYLEVGCAEGSLLKTIRDQSDWEVKGVELESARACYARSKELQIVNKPYSRELFPANSKTIISIHEALDHFDSVRHILNTIKYHLIPRGLVTVVNTIYDWEAEQEKNKFHHTTYFSESGITKLFELNRFELVRKVDLPLPYAKKQQISSIIRGCYSKCNYARFKSKHLFIAKVRK